MNHVATSREALLAAARRVAELEGLSAVSIRRTARECGVAVGTIYNYYPAKSDLIVALLEDFWRQVFHEGVCQPGEGRSFLEVCEEVHRRLAENIERFTGRLLKDATSLDEATRKKGRAVEEHYWRHIREGLRLALERDRSISPKVWSDGLTPEGLIDFTFVNLMAALRSGAPSFELLLAVLRRVFAC